MASTKLEDAEYKADGGTVFVIELAQIAVYGMADCIVHSKQQNAKGEHLSDCREHQSTKG
jgi:hypothetical protein